MIVPVDRSDADLLHFYKTDPEYRAKFQEMRGMAPKHIEAYHRSLFYYKTFYHDVAEFGVDTPDAERVYFIPGFNGTPAQILFGLPGIVKRLGPKTWVKCCHDPKFSARVPTWLKYDPQGQEIKRDRIAQDVRAMVRPNKKLRVVVSSSGFYDFLAAYPRIADLADQFELYWVSCAPDSVSPNKWEKLFYPINGFRMDDCKWFSYPNLQVLKRLNPECGRHLDWSCEEQHTRYQKNELESRFFRFGILWDYISIDYFNLTLERNLAAYRSAGAPPVACKTHVLAGVKDGFWDDSSPEAIREVMDRYLADYSILFKPSSHLWVVTPENVHEILGGAPETFMGH